MNLPAALACLAILGLGACSELPRTFEADKLDPHAPILSMPDAMGVLVEPVQGAPEAAAGALSGAMAVALQDADVPASATAGNSRSFHLFGTATPAAGEPTALEIRWSMRDAAGTELGSETQRVALGSDPDPSAAALAGPMHAVAPKLVALIQESAPTEHKPTRHLLIRDVEGAPGDGAKSLKRSLVFLLKRSGIPLTDDPAKPDTVAVAGKVEIRQGPAGQDHIKILWHVLKPDGAEAGVITQENDVPHAVIEGQWGDMAMAVADAAAADILRVAGTVPEGSSQAAASPTR